MHSTTGNLFEHVNIFPKLVIFTQKSDTVQSTFSVQSNPCVVWHFFPDLKIRRVDFWRSRLLSHKTDSIWCGIVQADVGVMTECAQQNCHPTVISPCESHTVFPDVGVMVHTNYNWCLNLYNSPVGYRIVIAQFYSLIHPGIQLFCH